jgi:3-oxoacyl-[acyl-carrier-protein] synthase II
VNSRSVVVTGLGCLTPIGNDVASFWESLLAGRSGSAPITAFDTAPYRSAVGCEVKGFRTAETPSEGAVTGTPAAAPAEPPAIPRASGLAIAAARQALLAAGLLGPEGLREIGPGRMAVSVGTTMGELNFLDRLGDGPLARPGAIPPWEEVVSLGPATIARAVAHQLGVDGPLISLPAACSAGNYAIGRAFDLIRSGEIDAAIAGGSEAFSESAYAGFARLGAMSPGLCQPFDLGRKGLLLGEGAGFLVLEAEELARRRGARGLARVLGYGLSCDAHHITGPHPGGEGAAACMRNALEDAGLGPEEIDYLSAHGTGTRQNDRIEALAIHTVFGSRRVPVSSIKALTGHTMGAASAIEAISCVLAFNRSVLPPTWNHSQPDPECDLDVIPNRPREARPRAILNNSYAFGGNNACVAFGRC